MITIGTVRLARSRDGSTFGRTGPDIGAGAALVRDQVEAAPGKRPADGSRLVDVPAVLL